MVIKHIYLVLASCKLVLQKSIYKTFQKVQWTSPHPDPSTTFPSSRTSSRTRCSCRCNSKRTIPQFLSQVTMIVMFFSDLVYCNFFVEALILKFCLNLLLYLLLKLYTEVFFINDSNHFLVRVKLLASILLTFFSSVSLCYSSGLHGQLVTRRLRVQIQLSLIFIWETSILNFFNASALTQAELNVE